MDVKRGGGSNKGSSFERDICKRFSLWISENARDDIFWRTAGSGARATNRKRRGQTTCNSEGDMGCLDAEFSWFTDSVLIECKRGYNSWRIDDALMSKIPKGGVWAIWNRLAKDACESNKSPLLVLKQDRRPVLFFFPQPVFNCPLICVTDWYANPVYISTTLFRTSPEYIRKCLNRGTGTKAGSAAKKHSTAS
jgi:hypothetical protein